MFGPAFSSTSSSSFDLKLKKQSFLCRMDGWTNGWAEFIICPSSFLRIKKKNLLCIYYDSSTAPRPLLFLFDFSFFATTLPTYLSLAFPWLFFVVVNLSFLLFFFKSSSKTLLLLITTSHHLPTAPTLLNFCFVME
jgi:hypothetical protein